MNIYHQECQTLLNEVFFKDTFSRSKCFSIYQLIERNGGGCFTESDVENVKKSSFKDFKYIHRAPGNINYELSKSICSEPSNIELVSLLLTSIVSKEYFLYFLIKAVILKDLSVFDELLVSEDSHEKEIKFFALLTLLQQYSPMLYLVNEHDKQTVERMIEQEDIRSLFFDCFHYIHFFANLLESNNSHIGLERISGLYGKDDIRSFDKYKTFEEVCEPIVKKLTKILSTDYFNDNFTAFINALTKTQNINEVMVFIDNETKIYGEPSYIYKKFLSLGFTQ